MTPTVTPGLPDGRPALLRAARVRRPHGVLGEVRAESLGGDARRFRRGVRVTVEGTGRALTLRSARGLGDGDLLLAFAGIDTPEAAAPLRGAYLCVEPQRARRLPPGEWFVWQLVGLAAVDPEGRPLGVVADVEAGPAHDVLVVGGEGGERRFPMVSAFVREVDVAGGRIVLTPWDEEEA
ncbi:MAG: ribosome maturation factor RimM [Candidatus Dormibacteria bacterium]